MSSYQLDDNSWSNNPTNISSNPRSPHARVVLPRDRPLIIDNESKNSFDYREPSARSNAVIMGYDSRGQPPRNNLEARDDINNVRDSLIRENIGNTNRNYDNRSTVSRDDCSLRDIPYNSSVQLACVIQPNNTVDVHKSPAPVARTELESRDQYYEDSRARNVSMESNYGSTTGLLRGDSVMDDYSRRRSQLGEYRDFSAQDRDVHFVEIASFVRAQEMAARTKEILLQINGFYPSSANATMNSTSPMSKISSSTTSQSSPGQGHKVQNRVSLAPGQDDLRQNGSWQGDKKQNMMKEASGQRCVRKNRMTEALWRRSEEQHRIREVSWQRDEVHNTTLTREAPGHGDFGQNRISEVSGHEALGLNRTRNIPEHGDERQKSIWVARRFKGEGLYKTREAPGQDGSSQNMIKDPPGQGGEVQNKTREAPGQRGERQSRIKIINPTTFFAHPDATVTGGVGKAPLKNRLIETSLCRQPKVDVTELTTVNINSKMNRNVPVSCIGNTQNWMIELLQKYNLVTARFCSTLTNQANQQSVEKSNITMQTDAHTLDSSVPCPELTLQSTYRLINPINSSTLASPQKFTDDVVIEPRSITSGNRDELLQSDHIGMPTITSELFSTPPASIEPSSKFANTDNKSKLRTDFVSSTRAMDAKDWGLKCAAYFRRLQELSTTIEMADGAREDGAKRSRTDDAMYVADEVHSRGQSGKANVGKSKSVLNAIRDNSDSKDTNRREIVLKVGVKESHKDQDRSKSQKRGKNKNESRSPEAKQFKREPGSQVSMKRKKSTNGESTNNDKIGDTTKNILDESKRCDKKENELKFESRKRKLELEYKRIIFKKRLEGSSKSNDKINNNEEISRSQNRGKSNEKPRHCGRRKGNDLFKNRDESLRQIRDENKSKDGSKSKDRKTKDDRSEGRERRPNKCGSDSQERRFKEIEERRVQIIIKLLNTKVNNEIKTGITQPLAPVLCYWMINRNRIKGREKRV